MSVSILKRITISKIDVLIQNTVFNIKYSNNITCLILIGHYNLNIVDTEDNTHYSTFLGMHQIHVKILTELKNTL